MSDWDDYVDQTFTLMEQTMGIQTFKIELRIDVNSVERGKVIHDAVVTVAKELLAITGLLSEGAKPRVTVGKAAFFKPEEIIDITGE
jgi:hypothetical protein